MGSIAPLSIHDLPNEVLQHILQFVPPKTIPSLQRTCKRFNALADEVMWRERCRNHYLYWRSPHRIQDKFGGDIYKVDWRDMFIQRQMTDQHVTAAFNSILGSQTGRMEKVERILDFGYDAKDCLLRHYRCSDEAEDVLARRYHSEAILGSIHRALAVQEWTKLRSQESVSLERALAAFDMFVLRDRQGDMDDVTRILDGIAHEIRTTNPEFPEMSTRDQAILVNVRMREAKYIGYLDAVPPQSPKNSFLGIALSSAEHSSLPLITCAIYCAVARRLGLDASPCGIPWKVIVIVRPPPGLGLDDGPVSTLPAPAEDSRPSSPSTEEMYLFPSYSEEEIPRRDLSLYLSHSGVPSDRHGEVLTPTDTTEMVQRSARNLSHAVQEMNTAAVLGRTHSIHRGGGREAPPVLDADSCLYAALWALLVIVEPPEEDVGALTIRRRNYLPNILELFETRFTIDIGLFEEHVVPLFENTEAHVQLREHTRVMRAVDSLPKQVKRRSKDVDQHVKYRVGQVFRHKRYDYEAVVTGWDVECAASEHWITQMRVNELAKGRRQSFYHVLVDDKSSRYVAEENVVPIQPEAPSSLMPLAGQYFKRWDHKAKAFISNMEDEYPDG